MYVASTNDRRGRKRFEAFADTREQAAREVLALDPKAQRCTTARAWQQSDGSWRDTSSAMIWHRRDEICA